MTNRRKKKKKQGKVHYCGKCYFCDTVLAKKITLAEYDEDETPDDHGYSDTRFNGQIICARCVRGTSGPGDLMTGDDELVVVDSKGQKITLSDKNVDVFLRKTGQALQDAARLADERELDEVDELVKEILCFDPDAPQIVVTDHDADDEDPTLPSMFL